ncbi:MAG: helix-turn-helix domain-containing protein [Kineosporiaceae bacterium]
MATTTPPSPAADSRGIVDPAAMLRRVDFARYPAGDALTGLVDWFWSVAWDLPSGEVHDQRVLNHPAGHISIGTLDDTGVPLHPPQGRVYGVLTTTSVRRLTVAGWTVAAKTTVGGLGVLLGRPARGTVDTQFSMSEALPGVDAGRLVADVIASTDHPTRVEVLREALERLVAGRDPSVVAEARHVAEVAALAERDRTVCRIEHLAEAADVSVRTLQRLFDVHVGVPPSFVIRRWRIIEAAEAARRAAEHGEDWRGWAAVAADLGYSDQAHLTRDFHRHLGTTPAAYVTRLRPGDT